MRIRHFCILSVALLIGGSLRLLVVPGAAETMLRTLSEQQDLLTSVGIILLLLVIRAFDGRGDDGRKGCRAPRRSYRVTLSDVPACLVNTIRSVIG